MLVGASLATSSLQGDLVGQDRSGREQLHADDDDPSSSSRTMRQPGVDLVVVGVNYRLGALGFLYTSGISESNLGILDQWAALRWVRNNITAFGGDPSAVT
jgi:hypothetical protein